MYRMHNSHSRPSCIKLKSLKDKVRGLYFFWPIIFMICTGFVLLMKDGGGG